MSSPMPVAVSLPTSIGTPSSMQLSGPTILSNSPPCDEPIHLTTSQLSQYVQQQHQSSSPDQSALAAIIPEKLDVNVDLSAFYGLQDKMVSLQEKIFYDQSVGGGGVEDWNNLTEILEMQRKRLVKAKRHRSENVSERDKILFLNILGPKVDIIENRRVGGTSKMQMWREVEAQFNATAEVERTHDQLRELWKRLKIAMKKELEMGRQKGFAPMPASITRTFSLLKDFEFVDDVSNNSGGGGQVGCDEEGGLQQLPNPLASFSEGQQAAPSSPYNSPYKPSLDSSTASDSSDAALISAFHLSSLFAKREDGKTLAERLSQADLSVSPASKHDALALVERITSEAEAKALAQRLAHNDLGHDLTITQVNTGGLYHLGNSVIGRTGDQDDSIDSKEGIVRLQHNSDSDNPDVVDTDRSFPRNVSESEFFIKSESVNQVNCILSNSLGKTSPVPSSQVPDLVKLQKTLSISAVGGGGVGRAGWEVDATRRGFKRRLEGSLLAAAVVNGVGGHVTSTVSPQQVASLLASQHCGGAEGCSTDDGRYSDQRLRNEQQRGKLLSKQLENETIRNQLLKVLLSKLKAGDSSVTLEAIKAAMS